MLNKNKLLKENQILIQEKNLAYIKKNTLNNISLID